MMETHSLQRLRLRLLPVAAEIEVWSVAHRRCHGCLQFKQRHC